MKNIIHAYQNSEKICNLNVFIKRFNNKNNIITNYIKVPGALNICSLATDLPVSNVAICYDGIL